MTTLDPKDPDFYEQRRALIKESHLKQTPFKGCPNCGCVRTYVPDLHILNCTHCGKVQAAPKTQCVNGHEYTPENTYVQPSTGHRTCRTCRRAHVQEHYHRELEGDTRGIEEPQVAEDFTAQPNKFSPRVDEFDYTDLHSWEDDLPCTHE